MKQNKWTEKLYESIEEQEIIEEGVVYDVFVDIMKILNKIAGGVLDIVLAITLVVISTGAAITAIPTIAIVRTVKKLASLAKNKSVYNEIQKFIKSEQTFKHVEELIKEFKALEDSEKETLKGLRGNKRKDAKAEFAAKVKSVKSKMMVDKRDLKARIENSKLSDEAKEGLYDLMPGLGRLGGELKK